MQSLFVCEPQKLNIKAILNKKDLSKIKKESTIFFNISVIY